MTARTSTMRTGSIVVAVVLAASMALPAGAAPSISMGEAVNGKVVQVKLGSLVSVMLHSTYWHAASMPQRRLLRPLGPVVRTAILPGAKAPAGCRIAGSGCGSVLWRFRAAHLGSARFVATRVSCGEAMRCTAAQGHYSVTIRIVR